jgi:hypothetical protein
MRMAPIMIYDDVTYDPARHLIFFVHIRKTGGTSLIARMGEALPTRAGGPAMRRLREQGLESHDSGLLLMHEHMRRRLNHWGDDLGHEWRRLLGRPNASVNEVALVSGHNRVGSVRLGRRMPLMITVTRDPIDRLVSDYFFTRDRVAANPKKAKAAKKRSAWEMDFEGWADTMLAEAGSMPLNGQCRYFSRAGDFASARQAIDDRFLLAAPLPQMARFTALLGAKLGVDLTEGPRANRGRSRPEGFEISAPLRARLEAALADDIALHAHVCAEFEALAARHGL